MATDRKPSATTKAALKGGGLGAAITLLIWIYFPDIDVIPQGAITVMGMSIGQSIGKECRNYTHGKEEQLGFALSICRIVGNFLV